jgi:thiamine biosynthesis lipoprotein
MAAAVSVLSPVTLRCVHRFEHVAMACVWELYLAEVDGRYAAQAASAAFSELDRLEAELSRFVPHSDIARINAAPVGRPVRVGPAVYECLELALRVHRQTAGAFDITLAAPADHAAQAAEGQPRLTLDQQTRSATRHAEDVVLDLGGIGKGYALDQLGRVLRAWRIEAGLAHCGQSTVLVWGNTPPGGWPTGLRDPHAADAELATVYLSSGSLSGSANVLHGGHVLDPRTGRPACGALSAWALAPTAGLADAFSTAFLVLGPQRAAVCCRQDPRLAAVFLVEVDGRRELRHCGAELRWKSGRSAAR